MAGEANELSLGDLVTLTRGTTYQSALLGQPGPVLLGLASIKRNGGFRDDNLKTYGGECPAKLTLRPGDIFVSLKDVTQAAELLGSIARVPPHIPAGRVTQDTVKLTFTRDDIPSRYIYWLLRTPIYREYCRAHAIGTTNLALPREDFLAFPIPRPKAREMTLVEVLDALDDKIELNRRMNATLEAMARALFQSWFVDFDPVRAKLDGRKPIGLDETTAALFPDSFQDSPIGPIPHAWIVKDLGEIADFDKGLSYKGEGLAEEGGMPMVNLGCFTGRGLFNANRVKRYTGAYRERHLVRAGDLVIANTDMTQNRVIIGSPAIVPELNGVKEFLFTHHVFAVRFKPDADVWRRYAFFTLLKPEFREIAEGFSTGTTVLALPRDGLANYSLCLPPIPLLEAFEKQVGPILATVDANLQQSRTLATLRDTLLPKLLSGELSVNANLLASTKS
jgi:type I restriction enzyme S subunit